MASERNIVFWDSYGIEYPYEISQTDTTDKTFVQVQVIAGTWILYKEKEYNSPSAGGAEFVRMDPGPKQTLKFSPGSFWRAVDERDSIVVFEHGNYAGTRKDYVKACADITSDFPTGTYAYAGASALIIWPSKSWELYTGTNYTGGRKELEAGWYPQPEDMGFPNNSLASIRPV